MTRKSELDELRCESDIFQAVNDGHHVLLLHFLNTFQAAMQKLKILRHLLSSFDDAFRYTSGSCSVESVTFWRRSVGECVKKGHIFAALLVLFHVTLHVLRKTPFRRSVAQRMVVCREETADAHRRNILQDGLSNRSSVVRRRPAAEFVEQ